MKLSRKIKLQLSYNEAIWFYYRVDTFNQILVVGLITEVYRGLYLSLRRDAIKEAYEHYNAHHPQNEFIHPDSVIKS